MLSLVFQVLACFSRGDTLTGTFPGNGITFVHVTRAMAEKNGIVGKKDYPYSRR